MKPFTLTMLLTACVVPAKETGHSCPCATGWQCCPNANVCVPEGDSCDIAPNPDAGPHERAKLYGGIDQPARCILGQSSILAQSEAAVSSIPPATGSMIQIVVTGLLSDGSPFSTQAMVSAN